MKKTIAFTVHIDLDLDKLRHNDPDETAEDMRDYLAEYIPEAVTALSPNVVTVRVTEGG